MSVSPCPNVFNELLWGIMMLNVLYENEGMDKCHTRSLRNPTTHERTRS